MGDNQRSKTPVYAAEDAATGLYLNVEGTEARLAPLGEASRFADRRGATTRLAATVGAGTYEVVRVQS